MGIRVGRATKKSMPAVEKIIGEAAAGWGRAWKSHLLDIFAHQGSGKYAFRPYVAISGGKIAAAFVLRLELEAMAIYFLAVEEDFQGRGIGGAILEFAEKKGKKSGAKFLRIDTYYRLRKGISFYKKHGFAKGGEVRNFNESGDRQVFLYRKI